MFSRILVANRGEIAVRIIRTCREMGIRTVAVCSEADRSALHTQIADEDVCIGPAPSRDSYLSILAILSAARVTGAEAIHPGFGFLSENPTFARICAKCGIALIGPSEKAMLLMGDKATARQTAKAAGVPVVPGSEGSLANVEEALATAEAIGYPVLVKAVAGGGGRGMRVAETPEALHSAFPLARAEARACFGDDRLYLEKYLLRPRHVEIQVLADRHGTCLSLGERDCSLQRRNQKLCEESPSPVLDADLRRRMGEAAVRLCRAVDYEGAGTVEFLLASDGHFYFMEMNTRIQVEHPVTEMVTGLDLIREQIRVAAGEPLGYGQDDVRFEGHAIECRINAESADRGFLPCPGTISVLHVPGGPGVRVDSAVYQGYTVPPYYDSLLAKLIVHARTRPEAVARMRRALGEFLIKGVDTTVEFQLDLLRTPEFNSGEYDTGFVTRFLDNRESRSGA